MTLSGPGPGLSLITTGAVSGVMTSAPGRVWQNRYVNRRPGQVRSDEVTYRTRSAISVIR